MTWILSNALMQAYANSHSLPEQEEASSVDDFLDGEQLQPLSGNPTHKAYLFNGRTTDTLPPFLSGMTCRRLTEPDGEDVLTWFLGDFLAKTSAVQEKVPASEVRVLDFGVTWRELFTKYDHDTCGWRTPPSLWDEGLTSSLPTLPRWGLMLDGALWERVTLVRPTYDTASGSLPTPVKYDSHGTWESNNYHGLGWRAKHDPDYRAPPKMWPTPVKHEDRAAAYTLETSYRHFKEGRQTHLAQAVRDVRMFPTPTSRDGDKRQSKKPPERVRLTASGLPEADRPSGTGKQLSLAQAAHVSDGRKPLLPTPTVGAGAHREPPKRVKVTASGRVEANTGTYRQLDLGQVAKHYDGKRVRLLPSPTSQNGLRGGGHGASAEHHPNKWQSPGHPEYGELNPEWVEWIMGWPIGWTSLEPMPAENFSAWMEANAGQENGLPAWWLQDPSDDPESGITKTVKPKDKADDDVRISRIAALGNGQVSAVLAATVSMLTRIDLPSTTKE